MSPSPPTFSHTGYRYLLGYDESNYGIWDRNVPGSPPLQTFPRSDEGWTAAWNQYVAMEPANAPVGAQPANLPTPSQTQAPMPTQAATSAGPPVMSPISSMPPTPPPSPQVPYATAPAAMAPAYGYAPPTGKSGGGSRVWIGIAIVVGVLVIVGVLIALAVPAANKEQDKTAEANMQSAIAAAKTYYTDSNSYAGFSWIDGEQLDPALTWNDSPVALVNQVSVRGVSKHSIVLVTKSESGHVLCFATGTLGDAQGQTDASAAGECAGGWPV